MSVSEQFYIDRDDFLIYIQDKVNPPRARVGIEPIDEKSASEAFRILYDHGKRWGFSREGRMTNREIADKIEQTFTTKQKAHKA